MKLVVLYKEPEDTEAFEEAYAKHIPLVDNVPGIVETRVTRFSRTLSGDGFYLMAEMVFEDKDAFKSGMRSPEMAEVGKDANSFAEGLMTMMIGA